jgi:superfamily II DNA or RNA helicase
MERAFGGSRLARSLLGRFGMDPPCFLDASEIASCSSPERPVELYFDRGTIVIESGVIESGVVESGLPAAVDAVSVRSQGDSPPSVRSGFRWDRRIDRWRGPACALDRLEAALAARGVQWRFESLRPPGFVPRAGDRRAPEELRPYQRAALGAWAAANHRGVVALPTGSGKTRIAVQAALDLGGAALFVVPTRALLHQWVRVLGERYAGPIGVLGDGVCEPRPLTVATYRSANLHLDRLGDHFDLLVIDEAHHLASDELAEVAMMCTARKRLGLTATVPESPRARLALDDLIGPVCAALEIESLAGRYLAPFDHHRVSLPLSPSEAALYRELRQQFLAVFRPFIRVQPLSAWCDFVHAARETEVGRLALVAHRRIARLLSLPEAKLEAIEILLDSHPGSRALVFAADNPAAYAISRRLLIPAVTCETCREERLAVLEAFGRGDYRALVSARVLDEGIDVPEADLAIIAGGSADPIQQVQRIGRVLRPRHRKHAVIYELVVKGTKESTTSLRRNAGVSAPLVAVPETRIEP